MVATYDNSRHNMLNKYIAPVSLQWLIKMVTFLELIENVNCRKNK